MPPVLVATSIFPSLVVTGPTTVFLSDVVDVQFLIGRDLRDRGKLHRNVSRKLSMQHQSLAVRLHDCAGQTVTILQRDLIGENCRG